MKKNEWRLEYFSDSEKYWVKSSCPPQASRKLAREKVKFYVESTGGMKYRVVKHEAQD
mgnify:CR=1 FL=1